MGPRSLFWLGWEVLIAVGYGLQLLRAFHIFHDDSHEGFYVLSRIGLPSTLMDKS